MGSRVSELAPLGSITFDLNLQVSQAQLTVDFKLTNHQCMKQPEWKLLFPNFWMLCDCVSVKNGDGNGTRVIRSSGRNVHLVQRE